MVSDLFNPEFKLLFQTPITFEVPGQKVHCPMIHATVNQISTQLILDTGSTDHVFTRDLALQANLPCTPEEPGTDHAGAPVPSWSVGDMQIQIEDCPLQLHRTSAIQGPPPFEKWGIGGFLSPQNLSASGHVLIDLVNNELMLFEADPSDLQAWLCERHPDLNMLTLKRNPGEPLLIEAASIVPFDPVVTMLNTGGQETEFAAKVVPNLTGLDQGKPGLGLSGADVKGHKVENQILRVGDTEIAVQKLLVRDDTMPFPYGLIGIDLLDQTVLLISADLNQPIYWLVKH